MALNSIDPQRGFWRAAGTLLLPFSALHTAVTRLRARA